MTKFFLLILTSILFCFDVFALSDIHIGGSITMSKFYNESNNIIDQEKNPYEVVLKSSFEGKNISTRFQLADRQYIRSEPTWDYSLIDLSFDILPNMDIGVIWGIVPLHIAECGGNLGNPESRLGVLGEPTNVCFYNQKTLWTNFKTDEDGYQIYLNGSIGNDVRYRIEYITNARQENLDPTENYTAGDPTLQSPRSIMREGWHYNINVNNFGFIYDHLTPIQEIHMSDDHYKQFGFPEDYNGVSDVLLTFDLKSYHFSYFLKDIMSLSYTKVDFDYTTENESEELYYKQFGLTPNSRIDHTEDYHIIFYDYWNMGYEKLFLGYGRDWITDRSGWYKLPYDELPGKTWYVGGEWNISNWKLKADYHYINRMQHLLGKKENPEYLDDNYVWSFIALQLSYIFDNKLF